MANPQRRPGHGLPKGYGRTTRRYRRLRQDFKAQCAAHNLPCWLCGQPIDYTAKPGLPDAFNLDHALPRDTHPELAEDPGNFRASHETCNKVRGTRTAVGTVGAQSRVW